MQSQDFKSLADAYSEMYAQKEDVLSEEVQLNEEEMLYDTILCHLLDEGFAGTVEDAEKIMSVMSDEWISSIVEQDTESMADRSKKAVDNRYTPMSLKGNSLSITKSGTRDAILRLLSSSAANAKGV
jgi:hypothetical protein